MDLFEISVAGYKRFRTKTTLKTNGKLIAIVGPNEAGKTSILSAIRALNDDESLDQQVVSRGLDADSLEITGTYYLDEEDRRVASLTDQRWFRVYKTIGGERTFSVLPHAPRRDLSLRGSLAVALSNALDLRHVREAGPDAIDDFEDLSSSTMAMLQSSEETLDEEDIDQALLFIEALAPLLRKRDGAIVRRLPVTAGLWKEAEISQAPNEFAIEKLVDRLPSILVFGEEERNLEPEYAIARLGSNVPPALANLADIAELDLSQVVAAHKIGDTAKLTTLEHAANKVLERKFDENWQQSGVYVTVRLLDDTLIVQVVNERFEFTSFAERSDGLRQFVALQSFAMANWSDRPVLIIDEAEQRLHYDAQADLVQMLARQKVSSKVIYTTHSAGCLPEDLGNGVRFARPSGEDSTRSEIVNKFWAEKEPGFAPLLFGMGASTLSFFPTRNALMVEGPTDMLVLPSMMKKALSIDILGFQIVPGLAEADKSTMSPIIGQNTGVLYVTDGDEAGQKIKSSLAAIGVAADNIFSIKTTDGNAVELEDFIDPALLLEAVNSLIVKFHGAIPALKLSELTTRKRTKALRALFKTRTKQDLPKVELAYEILDALSKDPERPLLDKKRQTAFRGICEKILARFALLKTVHA